MKNFDFFYEAQCVWDETMAENLAEHMNRSKEKIVVFSGNGHIAYGFGIPDRLQRRRPASAATLLLMPFNDWKTIGKEIGDFLWLTSDCSYSEGGN